MLNAHYKAVDFDALKECAVPARTDIWAPRPAQDEPSHASSTSQAYLDTFDPFADAGIEVKDPEPSHPPV